MSGFLPARKPFLHWKLLARHRRRAGIERKLPSCYLIKEVLFLETTKKRFPSGAIDSLRGVPGREGANAMSIESVD